METVIHSHEMEFAPAREVNAVICILQDTAIPQYYNITEDICFLRNFAAFG